MCKKDKTNRRPIDRVRDGAGSLEVTTPDDDSDITGMLTFGDGLYAVKERGVYEIKLADQIDPERKNIHVPNTVQRVLPYGSNEPWVGAVLLTGHELLKKEILNNGIDVDRAMLLVLEIAQNIASAKEVPQSGIVVLYVPGSKTLYSIRITISFGIFEYASNRHNFILS